MNPGKRCLAIIVPAPAPDILAATPACGHGNDPATLHGQERALIIKALDEHGWNQSQAARALGITRYHLRHRIKKYGLKRPPEPVRPA